MLKVLILLGRICGMFPYWYDAENGTVRFRVWSSVASAIFPLACNIWMLVCLFGRIDKAKAKFNPQSLLLFFTYFQLAALICRRLTGRDETARLFETIFRMYNDVETTGRRRRRYEPFKRHTCLICLIAVVVIAEILIGYIRVSIISHDITILLKYAIPLTIIICIPISAEVQYAFCFAVLEKNFEQLNATVADNLQSFSIGDNINGNGNGVNGNGNGVNGNGNDHRGKAVFVLGVEKEHGRLSGILNRLNGHFAIEYLLLTSVILYVSIYLSNDVILINSSDTLAADYTFKCFFNSYSIMAFFIRLWYLCWRVHRMTHQQQKTAIMIMKSDKSIYVEADFKQLIKCLEGITRRKLPVSALNFYTINMELIFTAVGTIIGFSLIFAQLNYSRNWIQ